MSQRCSHTSGKKDGAAENKLICRPITTSLLYEKLLLSWHLKHRFQTHCSSNEYIDRLSGPRVAIDSVSTVRSVRAYHLVQTFIHPIRTLARPGP